MKILVYDKYNTDINIDYVEVVSLNEIQERADFISFHVPYTRETHHYISSEFIAYCKKSSVIINTSRGGIMNTTAMLAALQKGSIGGLCVDVFEDEPINKGVIHSPIIYQELLKLKNVIATPHIAGWTEESKELLAEILIVKISIFLGFEVSN